MAGKNNRVFEDEALQASYELAIEGLRLSGNKITPARSYVLQKIIGDCGPHSIQSLADDCPAGLNTDQSTIYRTLETFAELSLVEIERFPASRQTFYRWKGFKPHHHMVCRKCQKVEHMEFVKMERTFKLIEEKTGYADLNCNLVFSGVCASCSEVSE